MIFLTVAALRARSVLMKKVGGRKDEEIARRLLDLDPDDAFALTILGELRQEAGHAEEAQSLFLRAIEAEPCWAAGYLSLGLRGDWDSPVSKGWTALGFSKASMNPKLAQTVVKDQRARFQAVLEVLPEAEPEELVGILSQALRSISEQSPEAAAELRPFWLIDGIQVEEEMTPEAVNRVLAEGPAIVPLLTGVLRSWGRGREEVEQLAVERALGLIGELGGPAEITPLEEFLDKGPNALACTAELAIERIRARQGVPIEGGPGPTVYQICAGEVDWGGEPEPPEPEHRRNTPERNDPCWCGSGKKYKKCHMQADEGVRAGPVEVGSELNPLRKRLAAFRDEVMQSGDYKRALLEYGGGEMPKEADPAALSDWIMHDRALPRFGRTVMEEFLHRRGGALSQRHREFVEAWARSFVGIYEVTRVEEGKGFEARDLLQKSEPVFVHDVSVSRHAVVWDGLLARLVPGERGIELTGAATTIPRGHIASLCEWARADRKKTGLSWPEYLKRRHPELRRQPERIAREWLAGLRLSNNDGEEFVLSTAVYEAADEAAAGRALRDSGQFQEDDEGSGVYRRLSESKVLLATLRLKDGELTVECNSRQRLERTAAILQSVPGLKHVRDEFTSQQALKRQLGKGSRTREPKPQPEGAAEMVQTFLDRHYSKWPDTQLPALGGKTPRQAARTRSGRKDLLRVLQDIENGEERKRRAGEPYFDVQRLRRELEV